MVWPDLGISTDTLTLVLGLLVFLLVRYYVRRHIKQTLESIPSDSNNPTSPDKVKTEDRNGLLSAKDSTCCSGKSECCRSDKKVKLSKLQDSCSCRQKNTGSAQEEESGPLVILYGTTTGTARQFSGQLAAKLEERGLRAAAVRDCAEFGKSVDEEFAAYAKSRTRLV